MDEVVVVEPSVHGNKLFPKGVVGCGDNGVERAVVKLGGPIIQEWR